MQRLRSKPADQPPKPIVFTVNASLPWLIKGGQVKSVFADQPLLLHPL